LASLPEKHAEHGFAELEVTTKEMLHHCANIGATCKRAASWAPNCPADAAEPHCRKYETVLSGRATYDMRLIPMEVQRTKHEHYNKEGNYQEHHYLERVASSVTADF